MSRDLACARSSIVPNVAFEHVEMNTKNASCHASVTADASGTNFIGGRKGPPADPTQLSSTSRLRKENDLFRLLLPIKKLKEKDMLNAYLQAFFCEYDGLS